MIRRRAILRIAGGAVVALVVLAVAGWLAFVPFAKEPGYVFVKAWGEKGTGPGQFNDPKRIAQVIDNGLGQRNRPFADQALIGPEQQDTRNVRAGVQEKTIDSGSGNFHRPAIF